MKMLDFNDGEIDSIRRTWNKSRKRKHPVMLLKMMINLYDIMLWYIGLTI